ncbi:hypothetical phage protein [Clostridium sp. CAG:306]|nr:hypothetical phage protein [Clostridium sp. CAG:306]
MLVPIFELFYDKKNITNDVSPYVTSIEYTDVEHGESDELTISFEDSEKLWQGAWIPSKGDCLRAYIGYEAEKLLNCGVFEIDELEYDTPPDVITVKGLATGIKKPLRQKNSVGYENKTLKQIAKEIADKHELSLVGEIADIRVDRITQNQERDLTFLTKLAEQYGYIFKIAENNLVFYDVSKLKGAKSTQIFYKTDLSHINLREKTSQKYKAVQVSYFDPKKKKTVKASARNESVQKGDTLKITARCSDRKQAIIKAKAALSTADTKIEGSIELSGNPYLIAGLNIEIKGIGHFSGKYHIKQARHVIDRASGYKTYCEVESC